MLTEKDYCDYDTSITLGELGFPLKRMKVKNLTDRKFDESIIPVLLYDAQKWLREEKEVEVAIIPEYNEFAPVKGVQYRVWVSHWKDDEFGYETIEIVDEETRIPFLYKTYTEALSEGIKEAVEILKGE
ncbi:MAG: hypothetical protein IJD91_09905 [Clostridia bacterium]|nr:hypothetical protein [Clostridia bacterium]